MALDKDSKYLPYIALLMVQLGFGSLPVAGKIVMQSMPAIGLVGFRVGITASVLIAFQLFKGSLLPKRRTDIWWFLLVSFFGVTFNQLCFIIGLSLTKASNAALLAVTIPIFTVLISVVFGIEKLRGYKILGIAIAACGVLILVNPANAGFSSQTTLGDFLVIMNSLCYGIFVVISKDLFTRNGALKSTAWTFGLASLFCVPLGIYTLSGYQFDAVSLKTWALTAHISLIGTTLPYLLVAWSIARVKPSTVAVFVYLQPLFGFCMAVIFLSEPVSFWTLLAAVLIFSGVFLVTRKRNLPANET